MANTKSQEKVCIQLIIEADNKIEVINKLTEWAKTKIPDNAQRCRVFMKGIFCMPPTYKDDKA
jgi:hypothetical protein